MIPFPFNENWFSFFVVDHLLVGQLCTNPKSDRSLLSCLKVTQCSTSEIGDAPLFNSCSLLIQVMTTGPLPAPSKCKSGQFNASDDPLEVVERKDTARKTQAKEFIEMVQAIIDETPKWPIQQIARDLGISHTTVNVCMKEDLKCRSYRRNCILAFDPAKNAIPRWCPGRKWHILMAVMRGNHVGGNWLMKWDEVKNSHGTLIDWCARREWPVNCMTVISAWWQSNMRFQRSSRRLSGRWTII